jgi:hypothetical protein
MKLLRRKKYRKNRRVEAITTPKGIWRVLDELSSRPGRRRTWIICGIISLVLIVIGFSYFISNETLRRYMEHQMNSHLKGYTVHVGRAYFHPITFALNLHDLTMTQDANPNPPVANIGRLRARVHWGALLRARVVGDFLIDRPKLYINFTNIRKEEESEVPLKEKGWQQALESIYPLKINVFTIHDGDVTYVDEAPYKPLHLSRVFIRASNIRNISSPQRVYPSSIHLEGTIFDTGRVLLDGNANFLEDPFLGIKAGVDVADMDLSYFAPIMSRANMSVRKGTLSAKGNLEYSPHISEFNLKNLDLEGADADYLHLPQTVIAEQQRVEEAAATAKKLSNEPETKIRADVLTIRQSSFGYVNKTSTPNYRLFIDHMDATLKHFSNQTAEGPAALELQGRFMGTGATKVSGTFQPETKNADFTVNVAIENTEMAPMSDLFKSFGNFDIKKGLFSFYAELTIKDNRVNGYVKPLFKDMQVYDRRPAQEKSLFHKVYVGMVGGISKLLENRSRKEVATKATISGPVDSPSTSTWQVIVNLIRNAFISSILPGFEKEVEQPKSNPSSEKK